MKKMKKLSFVVLLSTVFMLSSCIGSFNLTRTVYDWNKSVGDKFVNELVFLALNIVPVYSISVFVDAVVLNTIEFWTDENPMSMKEGEKREKLVEIDGKTYQLTSEKYKMTIAELGQNKAKTELVFRDEDQSWYLKKGKKYQKLVEVELGETAEETAYKLILPEGEMQLQSGFDRLALKDGLAFSRQVALQ
ncbi:DUF3332 domain-containing protein [Sunxiuqinia sp. sy24]|uniref:DUF3332 domain-containing protein n=1 Tax=Sunxiuqinia sp. sy24 TaxID=3461495 RepID=UPI004045D0E6